MAATCFSAWTPRRPPRAWRSSTATASVRFAAEATAERHSSHVLPLCAEALRAVAIAPADLAGIACGGGPGSFTGLRVGLSTVKGLALPTGVPLYVVSSLHALALDILAAGGGNGDHRGAVPGRRQGRGLCRRLRRRCRGAGARDRRRLPARRGRARRLAGGVAARLRPPSPATERSATPSRAASPSRVRAPSPSAAWRCCSAARRGGEPRQRRPDLRPPARHHRQEGEAARVMTADR